MRENLMMTTYETVFQLLKASLYDGEDVEISDCDAVFSEMKEQTIAALAKDWLDTHPSPEHTEWLNYCAIQEGRWIRVMYGQEQLLKLLETNHIPCVILKGAAATMSYPKPMLRTMGDVDFLVKRADFERTADLLEKNGYRLAHEKNDFHHHYGYVKNNIAFELHKRPGCVSKSDDKLISLFEQGIDERQFVSLEGFSFPVLPIQLNGLVLMLHINQHLRSGLGLRQIIDWMMYMNRLPEDLWQGEVLPMLQKTGMEKLALTVTGMCQKYLGLRPIVEVSEEYPCDDLMDYILEKGNFGRKVTKRERGIDEFVLSSTDMKHVFGRLQAGGLIRWKAAQKHKVLRPFAWAYQIFYILRRIIDRRIGMRIFASQRRKGLEQRKLIYDLGLRVDREIRMK